MMDNLDRIALIAHFGGVQDMGFDDALVLIRKLTSKQSKKFNSKTFAELREMIAEAKATANTEYEKEAQW